MTRSRHLAAALLVGSFGVTFGATSGTAKAGEPNFPRSIEAPAPVVEPQRQPGAVRLTLEDAVYLSLRYNRLLESADIARIPQRYNLRVVEKRFEPKGSLDVNGLMSKLNRRERITYNTSAGPTLDVLTPIGTQINFSFLQATSRKSGTDPSAGTVAQFGSIVQPLLRGGGYEVNMAPVWQARIGERINQLGLRAQTINTISAVVAAFRAVILAKSQIANAEDGLARSRQLLDVNRQLITAGRLARNEVVQNESQIAQNELGVLQARNNYDALLLNLLAVLAIDDGSQIAVIDEPEPKRINVDREAALDLAFRNRPDFFSAQLGREISKLNLLIAENGSLWRLDLVGSYVAAGNGKSRDASLRNFGDEQRGYTAGVRLSIPLNDPSLEANVVAGKVSLRQADLTLADTRRTVEFDVEDKVRNVDVAWRTLEIARRSLALSEEKLRVEREKLAVGRSSNFQVLSYETDLIQTRNQLLTTRTNYAASLTALDQALGTTLDTWKVRIRE